MLLSICIPTYNRVDNLKDCLNSIKISSKIENNLNFEVCISDNGSEQDVSKVVDGYKKDFRVKLNKNKKNLGFALNALKTVSMAKGEYVWMIGNDDLLLPNALKKLKNIFNQNLDVEFFFINSYSLNKKYIQNLTRPLDTRKIILKNAKRVSKLTNDKNVKFWEIIDPSVSWEFLIGIYLSIFKRKNWNENINVLNFENLKDNRYWSNVDNTLIHPMIMCKSFKNSKSYICSEPLSINLIGSREWGDLYEFIEIVRIPELLDFYRKEGLSFKRYLYCKNFSLRNFTNYFFKILIRGKEAGINYVNFKRNFLYNLIYPNVYLSLFTFIYRKLLKKFF